MLDSDELRLHETYDSGIFFIERIAEEELDRGTKQVLHLHGMKQPNQTPTW